MGNVHAKISDAEKRKGLQTQLYQVSKYHST